MLLLSARCSFTGHGGARRPDLGGAREAAASGDGAVVCAPTSARASTAPPLPPSAQIGASTVVGSPGRVELKPPIHLPQPFPTSSSTSPLLASPLALLATTIYVLLLDAAAITSSSSPPAQLDMGGVRGASASGDGVGARASSPPADPCSTSSHPPPPADPRTAAPSARLPLRTHARNHACSCRPPPLPSCPLALAGCSRFVVPHRRSTRSGCCLPSRKWRRGRMQG
ncbi:unnamed protein product [Urochloa humidicola]